MLLMLLGERRVAYRSVVRCASRGVTTNPPRRRAAQETAACAVAFPEVLLRQPCIAAAPSPLCARFSYSLESIDRHMSQLSTVLRVESLP